MIDEDQYVRHKKREHAIRDAAKNAAIWGGLAGAAGQLVNGNRSIRSILLRGLGTGALAAPAVAAGQALGGAIAGEPDPDDSTGYSLRGALGEGVGGGVLGAGLGYLLGSGRLKGFAEIPALRKVGSLAKEVLPVDNLVGDRLRHWASNPSHGAGLKAAALLGLGGGAVSGIHGFDYGMDQDFINNTREHRRRDENDY